MPILLDGNNLLHRLPRGARSRTEARRITLDLARAESIRVLVVFDGPPPAGAPQREELGKVSIVYSGARSADDVIVATLPTGNRARDWVVVTDDRGLRERALQAGAQVRSVAMWRRKTPPKPRHRSAEPKLSSHELAEWEEFFGNRSKDE